MNQKADIRAEIIEDLEVELGVLTYKKYLSFKKLTERLADALLADKIRHVKVIQVIEYPSPDALRGRIRALEQALDELCDEVEFERPVDSYFSQPLIDKIWDARVLLRENKPVEPDPETRRQQEALAAEHDERLGEYSDVEEDRMGYR